MLCCRGVALWCCMYGRMWSHARREEGKRCLETCLACSPTTVPYPVQTLLASSPLRAHKTFTSLAYHWILLLNL